MGMLPAGLLATYATDWLGAASIRRFSVRFLDQVWLGDELTCEGAVTAVRQGKHGSLVEVELTCRRQTGDIVLTGIAEFVGVSEIAA